LGVCYGSSVSFAFLWREVGFVKQTRIDVKSKLCTNWKCSCLRNEDNSQVWSVMVIQLLEAENYKIIASPRRKSCSLQIEGEQTGEFSSSQVYHSTEKKNTAINFILILRMQTRLDSRSFIETNCRIKFKNSVAICSSRFFGPR
jgi:hypothetical protein